MKPSDDLGRLLDDVLAPDARDEFRGVTLETTLSAVRSRKRRRKLAQCAALMALPLALAGGLWLQQQSARPGRQPNGVTSGVAASTPAPTIPGTTIRLISDEELFALFPGRPLALIGPRGSQQLVFLDELRLDSRDGAN